MQNFSGLGATVPNALYYPYIHIRDVNWLKATLLLFPQVRRMLPFGGRSPEDSPEIVSFTEWHRDREPLLAPANLFSPRVLAAQDRLASKLETDSADPRFASRYDAAATAPLLAADPLGFQIHAEKLSGSLRTALARSRLAWIPQTREPYDYKSEYIQLHPRVGEAVMSTLAVNCALAEGLSIVGDHRSGTLHRCLQEKDADAVYDAWLHQKFSADAPKTATAEELFEIFVAVGCDVSALTPQRLSGLREDREALDALVGRLREHAKQIPQMDAGRERQELFDAASDRVIKEWRADRANMSRFWRKFFGEGLVDTTATFVEAVADKLLVGSLAGGAAVGLADQSSALQLATAGLIGGGAGLVIGVVVHAGKSAVTAVKDVRSSPYRYLSMMEEAGVIFRTDAYGIR